MATKLNVPSGTRTHDPLLKREMLYRLSYGYIFIKSHAVKTCTLV